MNEISSLFYNNNRQQLYRKLIRIVGRADSLLWARLQSSHRRICALALIMCVGALALAMPRSLGSEMLLQTDALHMVCTVDLRRENRT